MFGQLPGASLGLGSVALTLLTCQHQVTQFPALLTRQGFQVVATGLCRGQVAQGSVEQRPVMLGGHPCPQSSAGEQHQDSGQ